VALQAEIRPSPQRAPGSPLSKFQGWEVIKVQGDRMILRTADGKYTATAKNAEGQPFPEFFWPRPDRKVLIDLEKKGEPKKAPSG